METVNQVNAVSRKVQDEYYVPTEEEKADIDLLFKLLAETRKRARNTTRIGQVGEVL